MQRAQFQESKANHMSEYFSKKHNNLTAYVPGEQPKDRRYVKLNTNESPYPPPPQVIEAAKAAAENLQLYCDPECTALRAELAALLGIDANQLVLGNGSDEILNFAFCAFGDESRPFAFPAVSYGFYPVFAALHGIPFVEKPLNADFSISAAAYCGINSNIVIANPNAPTGLALGLDEIEFICRSNPKHVVIIDEAYVDFGAKSAISLINRFDNLLVTGTFSKSRSLAGGRLGFGAGNEKLITDLNTIRYSTNPYNVSSMTQAAGLAAVRNNEYYLSNCKKVMETRERTRLELESIGFECTHSLANFLFARNASLSGREIYLKLKEMGILVRWFDKDGIRDFLRITIGAPEQMDTLISALKKITENKT